MPHKRHLIAYILKTAGLSLSTFLVCFCYFLCNYLCYCYCKSPSKILLQIYEDERKNIASGAQLKR